MSWGSGYETVDEEVGDTPRFEEEENDSLMIPHVQRVIRGAGMLGKWVEVVAGVGRYLSQYVSWGLLYLERLPNQLQKSTTQKP